MRYLDEQDICKWGVRDAAKQKIDPREDVIAKVVTWIGEMCEPRKQIRTRLGRRLLQPLSSYGWKHAAENGIGEYVANGEFIIAALRAGYRAVQVDPRSPNALFDMAPRRPETARERTERTKVQIIEAAGWKRVDDARPYAWTAPPGRAPGGPWRIESAWKWHVKGEIFRELAAKGWDVPGEYVGDAGMCTLGEYPKHPTKSRGRFITLSRALRIERMPRLDLAAKLLLANARA